MGSREKKKNKYTLTLNSRKVLLVMMTIVEGDRDFLSNFFFLFLGGGRGGIRMTVELA